MNQEKDKDKHHDNDLTVTVFSPREPEPRTFTWPKTTRVGDAAAEAAAAFGLVGGTPTFRNDAQDILDRDKPLIAEKVRDGDRLELVDIGGGV